jgi:hypothetical protein
VGTRASVPEREALGVDLNTHFPLFPLNLNENPADQFRSYSKPGVSFSILKILFESMRGAMPAFRAHNTL